MISRIFIDTSIPIYAVGAPHALKAPCSMILGLISGHPRAFWTDAEVLQELLHRYHAINRWAPGKVVFDGFAGLMRGRIEPIFARDVVAAAALAGRWPGLQARDLLHLAVMDRVGSDTLVSADRAFDRVSGITRLDPAGVQSWRDEVEA